MLDKVKGIKDLKKLSIPELTELSQDVRNYILSVVSQNGGHLASNLGVVELSVALEYVFDTRKDRLVWDVGHQSYTHKILTGRKESFATLRQRNGLSGFPKRSESICDPYDTGHSSTSIAAALGFAKARDLQGEQHKVIAVIGDGSMTGGQAFEALNLTAELDTDILVILNDNQLSISANVGGLSHYLNRIRASSAYTGSKQAVRRFLSRIPFLGKAMIRIIEAIKDSLRYILVNGVVFTELGFQYFGPVDGHDIKNLIEILRQVKERKGPVILHVLTQKGKGYKPAVDNATAFHGIAAFDRETGRTADPDQEAPSYTDVFSSTLLELAREDERILAVTAAMADGTGLERFRQAYPHRFFDIGIAEQTAVSYSTALALSGFRPVVAIYSSFLQRAFDQMIQDTALQNAPLLFAIDRNGLVGEDGPTHHGVFALSYLNQMPNMRILLPRDEHMLRHMMRLAFRHDEGPVALLYPKGKGKGKAAFGINASGAYKLPQWGKGQLLRKGFHVLIIAAGPLIYEGLQAAYQLQEEGVSVAVFDPCFLKPIDAKGIWDAAENCGLTLIAEENVAAGGLGWTVTQQLQQAGYRGRIDCLSVPDRFIPQGSQGELRKELGLDAQGMIRVIRSYCDKAAMGRENAG